LLDLDNLFNGKNIYLLLSNISYIINHRLNIIQVEYNISFYHKNHTSIIPSDLSLNYNLHLICHFKKIYSNLSVDSLAFIQQNKYFKCIEYININEKINFGIVLYELNDSNSCINFTHYFFDDSSFNYKIFDNKNSRFLNPLFLRKENYINNRNISNIKKLYISKPEYNTISSIANGLDEWKFTNIYNHYFCFCKGYNCLYYNLLNYKNTTQICKYKFYLSLIEENKYLYNKTDYLLADFPGDFQSLDDAYPVFQQLIKLKYNAYYLTINKLIIKNEKVDNYLSEHIIKGNMIDGDFLEKYFSLVLRLKAVVSGAEYFSFNNLFYYIEYITFISLTHGINYFKANLFNSYYGNSRYNKIVISTSNKVINLAKSYGWKELDLIKICLPKWDKLDKKKNKRNKRKNKSIFFFFTWRQWKENIAEEVRLKSDYFRNIIKLMNDKSLIKSLNAHGINLFFCLHHMLNVYKDKIHFKNNNIHFIQQYEIFKVIRNSNLFVTDFSSIIFEYMYQNKPFVMFIPDGEDHKINKLYKLDYFNLLKDLKSGKISFKNKFFDINNTIDKIIYYIENDFKVEKDLFEFYESFNLTCENNTIKFINYLENL
jgi:CDP-glycerol glycerophosphotransferase (TagB/SpsB family)